MSLSGRGFLREGEVDIGDIPTTIRICKTWMKEVK